MAKEIAEEYASSLADLTVNSKPLINMLTILAEENIDHAGVIVDTVEKHLEKVPPEIKLPVLYLVDSIIKNVGGAYTQKFSQSIVNMFTSTFKKVDEKIRAQMFKLRETWHDVFPATKLYQLDVKVNLIDPAWPIQAQPQQSNIHQTGGPSNNVVSQLTEEEEKMRAILAKKEQELLMLQRKKIEMELEQTRRQLELAEKSAKLPTPVIGSNIPSTSMPVAMVNPVMASVPVLPPEVHVPLNVPVKQRLGPPVARSSRIAPVSAALATARRDPRLARQQQQQQRQQQQPRQQQPPRQQQQPPPPPRIAPNVFDIQPLERPPKRHAVLTIDVPQPRPPRDPRIRRKKDDLDREKTTDNYIEKLLDQKKVKLPPIPKINRDKADGKTSPLAASPLKKRKDALKDKAKKRDVSKDSSSSSSPEKKHRKERDPKKDKTDKKPKLDKKDPRDKGDPEVVQFKELKNFNKDRYRRNRDKSDSPEPTHKEVDLPGEASNAPEIVESKDVDLRVLPSVELKPALIAQKRSSTEAIEGKSKKSKVDKFDILFGSEDVDLRQLPQVEEAVPAPPVIVEPPQDSSTTKSAEASPKKIPTPEVSPNTKDWHEVKEKEVKKTPSKLDIVRAKLAEATKGKDRLGRPLLFTKSPSVEKEREERRRSISQSGDIEDTDMRHENGEEFDAEDHKKTISIIMSQAKEQFKDGQLDKNQYNTLMYQVLQLNEKLKLKEAKQRESLEISKRKLKAQIEEDSKGKKNTLKGPDNNFGDIDERINPPPAFIDIPIDKQGLFKEDSDMRISNGPPKDGVDGLNKPPFMRGPLVAPPMFQPRPNMPGFNPSWRGHRPRVDEYVPRNRFRGPGPNPPFFRGKFNPRGPRPPYDPSMPIPLPTPQMGTCQGPCPLIPYERSSSPPPLGAPGVVIPPTDFSIIEYIDQDPVKTIQIDGIHREIRFYGETAIIMLDWDDPREIKFLPGCRRVTFDNKDSVVLSFNEGYKQVEIDDQVFDIRFGAPTRELYINGRWHECFFGGAPFGVIIDGKPHLVQLEGPLPQVDIGKEKRMDLVAGKLNLIVNATQMCPVYLDAKVQKFVVNGNVFTIRFVDALRTVLINEQPFAVKYGDLPEPIYCGSEKYFIRFSALPRNVKPGLVQITNMEGSCLPLKPVIPFENIHIQNLEVDQEDTVPRPDKTPSPDGESKGLDMLASLMPSNLPTAPASASEYSLAEPLFVKPESIPGLDTSVDEKQTNETTKPVLPILGDLNVTDLFAKLVATGIVQVPPVKNEVNKETPKDENKELETPKEDKTVVHHVDLLRPETLRVKQPGLVSRLYGGMQCGECGARFPPERTVRYSQHLDWHFRRNRRRRAPARAHWHYDLPDWLQYVELPDADHREKSWFDTDGSEAAPHEAGPAEAPSVPAGAPLDCSCALCGDTFHQFYNEDREEWHLRNSTRYEDKNYHPDCLEEYKASLTKEKAEPAPLEENNDVITLDKTEEAIEIADFNNDSDNESVVEVTADLELPSEPVEIDEDGDEDDVVLKAEPVEQVTVDDNDTDDETAAERSNRDQQYHVDLSRVKTEPQDNDDDMPVITEEEQVLQPTIETSHNTVLSSIDGNVQFESTPAQTLSLGGIRINISKPLQPIPTVVSDNSDKTYDDISLEDEPLPPGEEPELDFKLKPTLEGIHFRRQPPIKKGNELSGLCSVM